MKKESNSYRPSNETEGMFFTDQFCERCKKGKCEILALTMSLDVNDVGYPSEWIHDDNGKPTCTAFDARVSFVRRMRKAKLFRKKLKLLMEYNNG